MVTNKKVSESLVASNDEKEENQESGIKDGAIDPSQIKIEPKEPPKDKETDIHMPDEYSRIFEAISVYHMMTGS